MMMIQHAIDSSIRPSRLIPKVLKCVRVYFGVHNLEQVDELNWAWVVCP